MQSKFKDSTGREWNPFVTGKTLVNFEEQTGSSLFDQAVLDQLTAGKSMSKVMRLAYLSCIREARKLKLTFEDFCDAFESDVVIAGCLSAVMEALKLFFQSQNQIAAASDASPGPGTMSGR